MPEPAYIIAKDPKLNTVTIGGEQLLNCNTIRATKTNWLIDPSIEWIECVAKIRYNTKAAPAKVRQVNDEIEVVFVEPQRGGAPGQAVVCYQETRVICGGWIDRVA